MTEINRATQDYENDFLTPLEYLTFIEERLYLAGANKGMRDAINKILKPLADYMCNIIATKNINRDTIEGYFDSMDDK